MTWLVFLGFASADLAVCVTPQPLRDEQEIALDFQVLYWTIEWGGRLYLCMADQHGLRELCRAALTPSRSSSSWYFQGSYFRESDRDKPRTGLPRLPMELWVRFLIDEMNLQDEESTVRRALDSLIPPVSRNELARAAILFQ